MRRSLTTELTAGAGLLVTMGCGEACPLLPGVRRPDWPRTDPMGQAIGAVRAIRDDMRARVAQLVAERDWGR